jgi:hypothetical protein
MGARKRTAARAPLVFPHVLVSYSTYIWGMLMPSRSLTGYVRREHAPKRVSWTFALYHVVAFAQNSTSAALWRCGRGHKRGVVRVKCFTSKSARDRDDR